MRTKEIYLISVITIGMTTVGGRTAEAIFVSPLASNILAMDEVALEVTAGIIPLANFPTNPDGNLTWQGHADASGWNWSMSGTYQGQAVNIATFGVYNPAGTLDPINPVITWSAAGVQGTTPISADGRTDLIDGWKWRSIWKIVKAVVKVATTVLTQQLSPVTLLPGGSVIATLQSVGSIVTTVQHAASSSSIGTASLIDDNAIDQVINTNVDETAFLLENNNEVPITVAGIAFYSSIDNNILPQFLDVFAVNNANFTASADGGFNFAGNSIYVPEPTSFTLLAVALGGLGFGSILSCMKKGRSQVPREPKEQVTRGSHLQPV